MNERRGIYDKSKKDKNFINGDKSKNTEKNDKNNIDSKSESDDEDNVEEISHPYLFFHTDKDEKFIVIHFIVHLVITIYCTVLTENAKELLNILFQTVK